MMKKSVLLSFLLLCVSSMFASYKMPTDTIRKTSNHTKKKPKKKKVYKNTNQIINSTSVSTNTTEVTSPVINMPIDNEKPDKVYHNPMPIAPAFKDGQQAMLDFLKANIVIPEEFKKTGKTVTVNVGFTVSIDGKLKDIRVLRPMGMGCDEEAIRVVKLMQDWNPGKIGKDPIEMPFAIGVEFKN